MYATQFCTSQRRRDAGKLARAIDTLNSSCEAFDCATAREAATHRVEMLSRTMRKRTRSLLSRRLSCGEKSSGRYSDIETHVAVSLHGKNANHTCHTRYSLFNASTITRRQHCHCGPHDLQYLQKTRCRRKPWRWTDRQRICSRTGTACSSLLLYSTA